MQYMPIGFGGIDTRNGLVQSVYAEKAEQRLRMMEECELNMVGRCGHVETQALQASNLYTTSPSMVYDSIPWV